LVAEGGDGGLVGGVELGGGILLLEAVEIVFADRVDLDDVGVSDGGCGAGGGGTPVWVGTLLGESGLAPAGTRSLAWQEGQRSESPTAVA